MKVLVTGGTGFVGKYLCEELSRRGHAAVALASRGDQALRLPDERRCVEVLDAACPDAVIHLAAVSYSRDADRDPGLAVAVNVDGTLGLARALNRHDASGRVRFVFASTAQVYDARGGPSRGDVVLTEESPLYPQNLYAETKLAAELGLRGLLQAPARPVYVFRPFNHGGAGQRPALVLSGFSRQVVRMERDEQPPVLETGNLAMSRDFSSVRDIAAAYALAAEGRAPPGLYNLASGTATSLAAIVDALRGLTAIRFTVATRPEQLRAGEPITLRGSAAKFQSASGWRPTISLEAMLREILDAWREHKGDV